jgi:hypothetical protein
MSTHMSSVPGKFFGGSVSDLAGGTAARPAEEKRLPDGTFQLLANLPPAKNAAEQEELNALLAERYLLNQRTEKYIQKKIAETRLDLEAAHEKAKRAVRKQLEVIEDLQRQYGEASREWHMSKGRVVEAQLRRDEAHQAVSSLSRFATKETIARAKKNLEVATAELAAAEEPVGASLRSMNHINLTLLPAEMKTRDELVTEELRLSELMAGRDPSFAELGLRARV